MDSTAQLTDILAQLQIITSEFYILLIMGALILSSLFVYNILKKFY